MKSTTLLFITIPFAAVLFAGCDRSPATGTKATDAAATPAMAGTKQPAAEAPVEHVGIGTLNAIDQGAKTVNITHGPIASASWPGMTMSFKLANPSIAAGFEPGQRVEFHFTIESGISATVTKMTESD
jgi:Cu/Ag efflux protein CusF